MSNSRKRLIAWLGALLGIVTACLVWVWMTRKSGSGPSEAYARQMGFSSMERYKQIIALNHGANHLHDFTDDQFALVEDVLKNDGPKPRINAIAALSSLRTLEQQRHAIQLMKPHVREKGVDAIIYTVLQTYARGDGRPAVEEMVQDPDPDASTFAKVVLKNIPARPQTTHLASQTQSGGK
ncbi:MAG TPA: hypothetical protein VKU00_33210 [Chthonomonadaceae bacterium]|nr:hypothetical protein [Chthonomonadaceae bacterium]